MGSDHNPIAPKPKWGEFYSHRDFVEAAHQALQRRPFLIEHVTRVQVRAVIEVMRPEKLEPLSSWCDRCVAHWVREAQTSLSTENRRFPCT